MTTALGIPLVGVASPLNRGGLRSSLAAGEPTVGTFLGAASAVTAEVCAAAGVDWVLLDLEHGAGGEEQVGPVVVAAAAYGVPTVVRVESAARIRLGRVLDLGVAGVMLPRLDTAAEVAAALPAPALPPGRGSRCGDLQPSVPLRAWTRGALDRASAGDPHGCAD